MPRARLKKGSFSAVIPTANSSLCVKLRVELYLFLALIMLLRTAYIVSLNHHLESFPKHPPCGWVYFFFLLSIIQDIAHLESKILPISNDELCSSGSSVQGYRLWACTSLHYHLSWIIVLAFIHHHYCVALDNPFDIVTAIFS